MSSQAKNGKLNLNVSECGVGIRNVRVSCLHVWDRAIGKGVYFEPTGGSFGVAVCGKTTVWFFHYEGRNDRIPMRKYGQADMPLLELSLPCHRFVRAWYADPLVSLHRQLCNPITARRLSSDFGAKTAREELGGMRLLSHAALSTKAHDISIGILKYNHHRQVILNSFGEVRRSKARTFLHGSYV